MRDITHAQTILQQKQLEKLKEETGEETTKKSLQKAVDHYLKCSHCKEENLDDLALKEKLKQKQNNKEETN
ncbi:MAG: Component of type IV pili like system [Candidatus Methanohalarchaeum thermophilum]|uniref:Component of type IV pili like system n=1 Tax=Methanohalarchaeum thermophilum TaxID=1903181 RepID=A0A1Q6DVA1_METT1|nr:MAG: Component of type IV pili like system [Candidatus Methanohalarchaeum thermophilum]